MNHAPRRRPVPPPCPARRPGALRGYTLVELLVIIAMITVLLALLVPAVLEAIGAARTVQCAARLNQIAAAYTRYVGESGGLFPPMLTNDVPTGLFKRIEAATGLAMAPVRPAEGWGQPGPHWSIVLWPYLNDMAVYTCPSDPKAGLRGMDVIDKRREHSVALHDAPPESYALNLILFRTADDLRRQAGCTWGVQNDVDFNGMQMYTAMAEQRRVFPALNARILFFCGAAGQTVGSQFNFPFRIGGLVDRWEWHPRPASAAFADDPGIGSNYLFVDGHVEYRDELPGLWEWGYTLTRETVEP